MFDIYILIKMITVIQVLLSHQINSLLTDAGRSTSSAFLPFFPVCRGLPCPSVSHQTVHSLQTSGEETGEKFEPICLMVDFLFQVTADFHVIQTTAAQVLITCFSIGACTRAALGPMPFWVIVAWVESMKWAISFFLGLTNVSFFLQIGLIMDFR